MTNSKVNRVDSIKKLFFHRKIIIWIFIFLITSRLNYSFKEIIKESSWYHQMYFKEVYITLFTPNLWLYESVNMIIPSFIDRIVRESCDTAKAFNMTRRQKLTCANARGLREREREREKAIWNEAERRDLVSSLYQSSPGRLKLYDAYRGIGRP